MADEVQKHPYRMTVEETFSEYNSNTDNGLSEDQVQKKLKEHGKNMIESKKQKSLFKLILDQINNPVIYLLLGATAVSFAFGDIPEAIAIIVVILLNTIIGFWMEYQARTSVKALKKLNQLKTKAIRDGSVREVDSTEVVPGDLIELEAGDVIPADARVVSGSELKVDESPLTGESMAVDKKHEKIDEEKELADRVNMLYKGTALTHGKARAIIVATGMQTEIGKISAMAGEEDKSEIPLNVKLRKLSHRLIWVTVGLAAAFFAFGLFTDKELYVLLQTSIAWTVAAIPEGLPIVSSIALARGMLRLAKRNVIVKKLAAVETLGETTVIFTDKTGTLTENRLTVETIEVPDKTIDASKFEEKKEVKENENYRHILRVSVLCNDAKIKEDDKSEGDPLDVSLLEFFNKHEQDEMNKLRESERIHEDPFDSDAKFMGTINVLDDQLYIAGKGAAEPILTRSISYLENGEEKQINDDFKKKWLDKNDDLSNQGLKVIAFGFKKEDKSKDSELRDKEDFVKDLTFLGLVSFIDPAREDVKDAIKKCKDAGIKIVMVTGDHPGTARYVAEKVELADKEIVSMKGKDIESDTGKILETNMFARVDPAQKYNIVEEYKKKGEITAMTGDGVNDAPALKKADIGIAMGQRGTQIAQDVSDMILKDDSFPSIVNAIEEGRIIFGNIRKFIIYQLSYHLAEIIIIAGISFTLVNLPLLPLQLLFLNLLSDVFPALALGLGKGDKHIMKQKPKDPKEPILNKQNWFAMALYGSIMAIVITGAYFYIILGMNESKEMANTVAFFALAFSQLLHVFNMRDYDEGFFSNQVTHNKFIWIALAICITFLAAGYFIPLLNDVLKFETLQLIHWLIIAGASILTLILIQISKQIFKM